MEGRVQRGPWGKMRTTIGMFLYQGPDINENIRRTARKVLHTTNSKNK